MIDPAVFEKLAEKMRSSAKSASIAKIAAVHAEEDRQRAKTKASAARLEFEKYIAECAKFDEMPNLVCDGV